MTIKHINDVNSGWEPRVAKLETSMEMLTNNVNTLTNNVRDQGVDIEKQLRELTASINLVASPKQTNWSTIIAAIALILALGAAVFAPLNMRINENKISIEKLSGFHFDHEKLPLHPVGETKIAGLEGSIADKHHLFEQSIGELNDKLQEEFKLTTDATKEQIEQLDVRLQREFMLSMANTEKQVEAARLDIKEGNSLALNRIESLEQWVNNRTQDEFKELQSRRMGVECAKKK